MILVNDLIKPLRRVRGMYYGWWLVGLAAVVMSLAIVPFFYGMPIWFVALEHEFKWSRFKLTSAMSLTRIEGSIMGPISGYLLDKVGPRIMVLIGLLIMGSGFVLFSMVRELWHYYAAFIVMSVGTGLGTWLAMMTVMNSWFVRRRATAMSLVSVGFHLGAAALVPVLAWSVGGLDPNNADRFIDNFGWRDTARGIGFLIIILAFPISRIVRNRPEDHGLRPDGDRPTQAPEAVGQARKPQANPDEPAFTWQQAIRTRTFWLVSIGHGCTSVVIVTLMTQLGPMLTDQGFSLRMVGWVISAYTFVGIVFTFVGGYVGDRWSIRLAIFGFCTIQSLAVIVLLLTNGSTIMVFIFVALLGISMGRAGMSTAIVGVYFGRRVFASIMGIGQLPMNVLMFVLPPFAAYMFDTTGSYTVPFSILAVISFIGSVLYLLLGEPNPVEASPTRVENETQLESGEYSNAPDDG